MTVENGVSVVTARSDADVSVFDAIDITAQLKVRDSHGDGQLVVLLDALGPHDVHARLRTHEPVTRH